MTKIFNLCGEETFEDLVLNKKGPVFVVFYMKGCTGYIGFKPVLEKFAHYLEENFIGKEISIVKVNVLTNLELAKKYRIGSVPDTHIYENGKRIFKWGRAVSFTELKNKLGKFMLSKLPLRPEAKAPGCLVNAQTRFASKPELAAS